MNATSSIQSQQARHASNINPVEWFLQLAVVLLISTSICAGQSTITSPPAGSTLGYPGFTLTWRAVSNADQSQLSFGSTQGKSDYGQVSCGNWTSVSLNWLGNRPAGCWVRLWTHVVIRSSTAKSTVAAQYWAFSDAYFKLASGSATAPASDARALLIADYLNTTSGIANSSSNFGGQCKEFLAKTFNLVGQKYRLPNGSSPLMPNNPVPSEGTGVSNWYWAGDLNSGWDFVADVKPAQNDKDKYNAVMDLLRKVQKGDTLQFVMRKRTTLPAGDTNSYSPHTIAFRATYVSDGTAMDWVDSNLNGDEVAYAGTVWPWQNTNMPKTPDSLALRIALQYGACTLYRVRTGISKR